jgi:hypothetical protein
LRLEGVVLSTVAVYHFVIATALFGPQAVGGGLAADEQTGKQEGESSTHR